MIPFGNFLLLLCFGSAHVNMPGKAVTATVNRVWVEGSVRRTVRGSARTKTLEFSVLFFFFGFSGKDACHGLLH